MMFIFMRMMFRMRTLFRLLELLMVREGVLFENFDKKIDYYV